ALHQAEGAGGVDRPQEGGVPDSGARQADRDRQGPAYCGEAARRLRLSMAEARQARTEEFDRLEEAEELGPEVRFEPLPAEPLAIDSADERLESLVLGLEPPARRFRRRRRRR